jgi:hypothetical protein
MTTSPFLGISFAPPFRLRSQESASQRFSIWLAGWPDCRNGFETVDGFDPVAAGSIYAQRLFSASVILICGVGKRPINPPT